MAKHQHRRNPPAAAAPAPPDPAFRKALSLVLALATAAFVSYLCAFKLFDRDFWMHMKIGELVLKTHWVLSTDPFAYTRAGQPFLANHEWLSQIALYLIYHLAGAIGIILFRTGMIVLTFALLLAIDPARLWPNGLVAIWAAILAQPGYVERPQLFTYAIFAAFLLLAYRYLEDPEAIEADPGSRRRLLATFLILQILWVNFHGGACILGLMVAGALLCERFYQKAPLRFALILVIALSVASFLSPITYHNVTYLYSLMTDKTTAFIGEHQPRAASIYWPELGPFWAIGLLCLFLSRRGRVFSLLVLAGTAYLSLKALRHEMLFDFAVAGAFAFHCKQNPRVQALLDRLSGRPLWAGAISAALLAVLAFAAHKRHISALQADGFYAEGYGTFAPAKGAVEFVEREHIPGPLFNTYGIGGYLIWKGLPVYIDGRNVDYGFDFMLRTFEAGKDPSVWKELAERYGFNYAIIDYDFARLKDYIPFSVHLDDDPDWVLVYIDDWSAVYVKNTPANQGVIARLRYRFLNPERMDDAAWFSTLDARDVPAVARELQRAASGDPDGVKALLDLARLRLRANDAAGARSLALEAEKREPLRPQVYELLAAAAVQQQDWKDASALYHRMIALAGDAYPNLNYRFIEDVDAKAAQSP